MLCYNCFRRFKPHEVWFRCCNTNVLDNAKTESCPLVEDQKAHELARLAFPVHGLLSAIQTILGDPKQSDCPKCGVRSTRRLCPHCHWELFPGYGRFADFITPILGNHGSGKTSFFTVMSEELKRYATVQMADAMSRNVWLRFYYYPLFQQGQTILRMPVGNRASIVYHISFSSKATVTNVWRWVGGQTVAIDDEEAVDTRYLWASSGLILLVNPRDVPAWDPYVEGGFLGSMPTDLLLSQLVNEFRKNREIYPAKKLKPPLAICISQFDRLSNGRAVLGLSDEFFDPVPSTPRRDRWNAARVDSESDALKNLLLRTAGPDGAQLVALVEENFVDFKFFAVSVLARSVGHSYEVPEIKPNRVADPMLWLMSRVGALRN